MTYRLQNMMLATLLALATLFVDFGTLSQNPTSGGYQLFERASSSLSADIQLASLGNLGCFAKTARECCIAPDGAGGDAFDPVAFAQGQQRTVPCTGIDEYTAGTLKPGDTVYQLGDKTPGSSQGVGNFFDVNGESVLTAPDGVGAMDDLQVQVNPNYGPYDGFTTFQVTDEIPFATSTVEANPQFGQGGATQGVIDIEQFGSCLTPVCFTEFPNGSGQ